MTELVVADASPLIVLGRIGHLATLSAIVGRVIVPDAVCNECLQDRRRPGASAIEAAFAHGWLVGSPGDVHYDPVTAPGLGPGEASAIGLAIGLNAVVLIDERLGRQVAIAHHLKVLGTLGVLLRAKQRGLLNSMQATLNALEHEGFHVAPALAQEVLNRAGESNR